MTRFTKYRIALVWLLAIVFALPYIAKSVHIYNEACHESVCQSHASGWEDGHAHGHGHGSENDPADHPNDEHGHYPEHDCESCLICQLAISFFTETERHDFLFAIRELSDNIYPLDQEEVHIPYFTANNLRAPPFCRIG